MRTLKFRVWDIKGAKMHYPSLIAISVLGACRIEVDVNFLPGESIIQQFTGLKDKYGREIYEGDIIEDSWRRYHVNMTNWPGFVIFEASDFVANCSEMNTEDDAIILGNCFEHPELIKR